MHTIAAKAVCFREAMEDSFVEYQKQVVKNAAVMAERLKANGLRLVSGGTDNHLMLVDVSEKGTTGKEIEALLDRAHITVNKNTIPFEKLSPFVTSGIRIGSPSITSRGIKEDEASVIADLVSRIIYEKEDAIESVAAEVDRICSRHPVYVS